MLSLVTDRGKDSIGIPKRTDLERLAEVLQARQVPVVVSDQLQLLVVKPAAVSTAALGVLLLAGMVGLVLIIAPILANLGGARARLPREAARQDGRAVPATDPARGNGRPAHPTPPTVPPPAAAESLPDRPLREYQRELGHSQPVAISADGRRIFSLGREVSIWDEAHDAPVAAYRQHEHSISAIALAGGTRVVTADLFTAHVWDAITLETIHVLRPQQGARGLVAVSPGGRRAAMLGVSQTIHVWDLDAGSQLAEFFVSPLHPAALTISRNGRFVFVTDGSQIGYWNLETGELGKLTPLTESRYTRYNVVALPRDGVAIFGDVRGLLLWDMQAGTPREAIGLRGGISAAAVTPDGRRGFLAQLGVVTVWDFQQAQEIARFQAHPAHVTYLAVSPDGRRLVTCGGSKMRLWEPDRMP